MSNAAIQIVDQESDIVHTLRGMLCKIPEVKAVFLQIRGADAQVNVIVNDYSYQLTSVLSAMQDALFDQFDGLNFDVTTLAAQGRVTPEDLFPGLEPIYTPHA